MIKFSSISRAKFDLIPDRDKNPEKVYFVDDGSIYKGSKIYTSNVLNVDELPERGKPGMIYILPYGIAMWNVEKSEFQAVVIENDISDNIDDSNPDQSGIASIPAIKKYVNEKSFSGSDSSWEVIE